MLVEENVSFATITTFKAGGVVRYVVTVASEDDVKLAVEFARTKGLRCIPLGGGSNMLGQDGVLNVVCIKVGMQTIVADEARATLTVAAGAIWNDVVTAAADRNWWGIENLSSIPGTMGGAVVQNIGAYGAVLADSLVSVRAFDTTSMRVVECMRDECAFGYRTSMFKQNADQYVILSVTLALSNIAKPNVEYKDLRTVFGTRTDVTVHEVRTAVDQIRATKFPPLSEFGTAGSFFLNPVVSEVEAARLQKVYPSMPVFALPEGGVKIPLGWFFEHVLKLKGFRDGAVEAWRNQALVIVAHDGATATDVKTFAQKIIARADSELKIKITPEVRLL